MSQQFLVRLSVGDRRLIIEALQHRASRHETMARSNPHIALEHERTAEWMRDLLKRLERA